MRHIKDLMALLGMAAVAAGSILYLASGCGEPKCDPVPDPFDKAFASRDTVILAGPQEWHPEARMPGWNSK